MQHTTDEIDELIGKYLAGEATAEEAARVEAWEHASEANGRYMHQFRTIFDKACAVKTLQPFDTDAAWNNLQRKIRSQQGTETTPEKDNVRPLHPPAHRNLYLRIAASVLIVLGIGYLTYRATNTPEAMRPITVIADAQTVADTLPDGSDVYLNKQTKLVYAYDKKKQTHTVKLKGEAYFSINHEDTKKFIVDVGGDVFIRDIGTRFNVTAYEESNTVEVVVVEGEVEFFTKGDSGVRLQAGGKGVYNRIAKTFSIEKPESNALAYKTRFFSFSNTPMAEAVAVLNEVYDQKIVISKNIENCPITVSFNDEDIYEIAEILAGTFGTTVQETGDTLTLEGHGCNP